MRTVLSPSAVPLEKQSSTSPGSQPSADTSAAADPTQPAHRSKSEVGRSAQMLRPTCYQRRTPLPCVLPQGRDL